MQSAAIEFLRPKLRECAVLCPQREQGRLYRGKSVSACFGIPDDSLLVSQPAATAECHNPNNLISSAIGTLTDFPIAKIGRASLPRKELCTR
jgi:hypothetical protein